jgi:hypothetical protein
LNAKRGDLRVIIAKAVCVVDTSERDRALKELLEERIQLSKHKRDMAQALLEINLLRSERDRLVEEVQDLRVRLNTASAAHPPDSAESSPPDAMKEELEGVYTLLKTISVSQVSFIGHLELGRPAWLDSLIRGEAGLLLKMSRAWELSL